MNFRFVLTSQFAFWVICALALSALGTAFYLVLQRIQLRQRPTPREKYEEEIGDLIDEAKAAVRKLRRAARASKRINRIFSLIEIIGGDYFAIASGIGAATGAQTPNQKQLELNLIVGFAIVVASGVQNKFHPFANGIELDHRVRALEVAVRKACARLMRFRRDSTAPNSPLPFIEDELNSAIA